MAWKKLGDVMARDGGNCDWCKPYVGTRVAAVVHGGGVVDKVAVDGVDCGGSPELLKTAAQIASPKYDEYDKGYFSDGEILLAALLSSRDCDSPDGTEERPCADCPWFDGCDKMAQELWVIDDDEDDDEDAEWCPIDAIFGRNEASENTITIPHDVFRTLLWKAIPATNKDEYIAKWNKSPMLIDADVDKEPDWAGIATLLSSVWDLAHMTVYDMCLSAGLNATELSKRFLIPLHTVYAWRSGDLECPLYVRLMMAELLGLCQVSRR